MEIQARDRNEIKVNSILVLSEISDAQFGT